MKKTRTLTVAALLCLLAGTPCWAQRVRFSNRAPFAPAASIQSRPTTANTPPALFGSPATTQLAPVQPPTNPPGFQPGVPTAPTATIQSPVFDAFSTQPTFTQPAPFTPQPGVGFSGGTQPTLIHPPTNAQPVYPPGNAYPGYPGYPNQPNSLYPGWQPGFPAGQKGFLSNIQPGPYLRLFQDAGFEYTWLSGGGGNEVDINDVEIGVTMNLPNFLYSGQPLQISPSFVFHFWDGPSTAASPADLPSKSYSTFVTVDWTTRQDFRFGGEVNFVIGLFTDFQTVTTDSIRLFGTGLGWMRLTDNLTIKAGVTYLDRLDIKILPAGGLFWRPTPDINLELYFPNPKIARRLTQIGNTDLWIYFGGEYGGGSWTIQRAADFSDRVDINDIRVFGGFEWTTLTNIKGFVEAGYVFDRELVYRVGPPGTLKLSDTFMISAGLAF